MSLFHPVGGQVAQCLHTLSSKVCAKSAKEEFHTVQQGDHHPKILGLIKTPEESSVSQGVMSQSD